MGRQRARLHRELKDRVILLIRAVDNVLQAPERPLARFGEALIQDAYQVEHRHQADADVPQRRSSARQWSGYLHLMNERFGLSLMVGDPGGGGLFIRKELASSRQLIEGVEREVVPIVTPDNATAPVVAQYLLRLFRPGDPGIKNLWPEMPGDDVLIDAAHGALREAIDHAWLALPRDAREWRREEVQGWSEERQFALRNLSEVAEQLRNIGAATKDDGTFAFTKRNARQFSARGRKDLAYALLYAWVAFLIWLKSGDDLAQMEGESAVTIKGW